MRVAAAQCEPVYLDPGATAERVVAWIERAAQAGVDLIAFGETFLPGYPVWLSETGGARFDDPTQKACYAAYLAAAVTADGPELRSIANAARHHGVYTIVGVAERGVSSASGTVFASLVHIDPRRGLLPIHRKLVPTFEERLVWGHGDGHGLRVHEHSGVAIGGLNCWENWMPLARHTLYAQGEQLHVAIWPGSARNTSEITRFIAREGRVFVLSASALLRRASVPTTFPAASLLPEGEWLQTGGSAIAGPDGEWLAEPIECTERLVVADIDLATLRCERQSFDPTGHYFRADVFSLNVNRTRHEAARFSDES